MNKEEVRQKMLVIVGDIYHAHAVATAPRAPFTFDGLTWKEAKDMINKAFDGIEPDHPKVKLPQEVGEELEDYKDEDIDLHDYLHDVIDSKELRTTRVWMLGNREQHIGILADAYRYGWEAEPEAKWYVKTPEAWESEDGDFGWLYKSIYGGVDTTSHGGEENEQFTRAELKHYHLDNDIFTLVPVEEYK